MGSTSKAQATNMKIRLAAAVLMGLSAFLKTESNPTPNADPWITYGYGLGRGYSGYANLGYGLGSRLGYGYGGYYGGYSLGRRGYGYGNVGYWGRKKRDSEPVADAVANAEPDADPWLRYGYGLGYGHGYGLGHSQSYSYGGYGLGRRYGGYIGYRPYTYGLSYGHGW